MGSVRLDSRLEEDMSKRWYVVHAGAVDSVLERARHGLLEARIGVHDVPPLAHVFFQPRIKSYRTHSSVLSLTHKKTAITTTKANTAAVVCIVSLRLGPTTFFTSAPDPPPNTPNC